MNAREIQAALPAIRPRHVFMPEDDAELLRSRRLEFNILENNRRIALASGVADDLGGEYRRAFELARFKLDRDATACALLWRFKHDEAAGKFARAQFVAACRWPRATVLPPFDEIGLSLARTLPSGLDWCWEWFSEPEKDEIISTLIRLGHEIMRRIDDENFAANPGNSHTARLPGYLGEIALVLHGLADEDMLERWLDYAVNFYDGVFPFYGDANGGWAEGPFYASSYTKWFLPFFFAVERTCGHSFFEKPFYRRVAEFFVHSAPPGQESHPFGDGHWPTAEEWPGFQAQDPFSVYANTPLSCRFSRESRERLEYFELHVTDMFLPRRFPCDMKDTAFFCAPESGFLCFRRSPEDPGNDVALLARAGTYGSPSHQHADQGDFAILARGLTLLAPSGYYGYQFGTDHHRRWTVQTPAADCLLIDGRGQTKGDPDDVGIVVEADADHAVIDLSRAYGVKYRRTLRFDRASLTVEVADAVSAPSPVEVEFRLHSYVEPRLNGRIFTIERPGARLCGEVSPAADFSMTDCFDPPCPELPAQYHLAWRFPAAREHRMEARFRVELI
ncbi:MAG: heparinase II/III family protein [Victivallaceae bacterium]|nr:heparinase II/III family protein [Victivallaceae bacterium]